MLARRLPTILPPMTEEEALEVTKIYSIAGLLSHRHGIVMERPFRSPHHTVSNSALIGGGSIPKPGEVTLSIMGYSFLMNCRNLLAVPWRFSGSRWRTGLLPSAAFRQH